MTEALARLAANPAAALELGKAAEHLVCADLTLRGYRAFLSDQGLPYDVLIELGGSILRIQVKGTAFCRNINAAGRPPRLAYSFSVRRNGKNGRTRLSNTDCDLVALVALDIRQIAYMRIAGVGQTVQLCPPGTPESRNRWGSLQYNALSNIDQYPIERLVEPTEDDQFQLAI